MNVTPPPPPPPPQVAALNHAIGATSALSAQCRQLVRDYLPQIIAQLHDLPLDQVGEGGASHQESGHHAVDRLRYSHRCHGFGGTGG